MKNTVIPLSLATAGEEYIINHIKNGKTSAEDLAGYGLMPNTKIKFIFASPAKDPRAYEVMGTVIALRNEDADNIFIKPASHFT